MVRLQLNCTHVRKQWIVVDMTDLVLFIWSDTGSQLFPGRKYYNVIMWQRFNLIDWFVQIALVYIHEVHIQ